MPGLITHYICCEGVLNTLEPPLKTIIENNRQLYNIGSQGPDIFFYYLPSLIKKRTKNLGIKMHEGQFGAFLKTMCEIIQEEKNQKDRDAALSYLCGYLTHYALDRVTHPYVYYKSGFRREGETIRGLKFSVNHRNLETAIDIAMLKLVSSKKPMDVKLWQLINAQRHEAEYAAKAISKSIHSAYGVNIRYKEVYRAMSYMKNLTRLMQSTKGRRKRIMEFVEDMTVGGRICSSLIHNQDLSDGLDYLNEKKAAWRLPWDNTSELTHSFTEMFDTACAEAKTMLNAMYSYYAKETDFDELMEVTEDRSFKTGLPSGEEVSFAYHDIIFNRPRTA